MTPPITIRRHVTESGKRGYRWQCLCGASGMHRFDRWTDHVRAVQGRLDPHPWQRCVDAANWHLKRHHPCAPAVHVHVHVGGGL